MEGGWGRVRSGEARSVTLEGEEEEQREGEKHRVKEKSMNI